MEDYLDPKVASAISSILAQEGSPEDHILVQRWIAEDPERARRIDLAYRVWGHDAHRGYEYQGDVVAFLNQLHRRLGVSGGTSISLPPQREARNHGLFRRISYSAMGIAAGALLLVLGWQSGFREVSNRLSDQRSVYSTANGQRAKIVLPDGSTVQLNVGSRIEVPADYSVGNRSIKLEGEAIFDVIHSSSQPLTVQAGSSLTRVLGTRFLVRHYSTDTAAIIAVKDGKVAVGDIVLTAEEQITVSAASVSPVQNISNSLFTFASGSLTLDEMSLEDAVPALSRWYDAEIRISNNTIAAQKIKGTFTSGSLSDLSEILELAFDIKVVRDGRVLILSQH